MDGKGKASGRKRGRSLQMADTPESSSSSSSSWARLVSIDTMSSNVEIQVNEMTIDSMIIGFDTLGTQEYCKIRKNQDLGTAKLQNMSSRGILINGQLLKNNEEMVIESGCEIILGPQRKGYPLYNFQVICGDQHGKRNEKVTSYIDNMKCSICLYIWHDVVSVTPCLHSFCNACFSLWYKRSVGKGADCVCPQCRSDIYAVGRNHSLHNLVECLMQDVLKDNLSLQRSAKEIKRLDELAMVKSNVMIIGNNTALRRHAFTRSSGSSDENSDNEIGPQCPQCEGATGSSVGGFHCGQETTHLTCQSCWGMMPLRTDIPVPQTCVGCGKVLCGAYWQLENILNPGSFNIACNNDALMPMLERLFIEVPRETHQGNNVEQDITKRYILQQGKMIEHIVRAWLVKLDVGEIDQPKLPATPVEQITSTTYLCNKCSDTVAAHLLQLFRLSVPKSDLPPDAAGREDCWYGYQCRTQHHNEIHARKRNHVCEPIRRAHQ